MIFTEISVKDGEPWFAAHDVAVALGYRDAEKLTRLLKREENGTYKVGTLGGEQSLLIINEKGLYRHHLKNGDQVPTRPIVIGAMTLH